MALRRVFMVGTGLLLIRGEEAFAEETYSPNPFMNAGSLVALFAADILIRRSLGSRKIQATFAEGYRIEGSSSRGTDHARVYAQRGPGMPIRDSMRHNAVRHKNGHAGFTLIELVVVVGLIAVVLAIVTAVMRAASNSFQLRRSATVVTSELRRAQSSAVAQNIPYAVEFILSSPYGINEWKQPSGGGWVAVPRPVTGSENWPSQVSIVSVPGTPNCSGISGSGSNWCVTFQPLGFANQGGSVQLQNQSGTSASIILNAATGRVSITP